MILFMRSILSSFLLHLQHNRSIKALPFDVHPNGTMKN